MVQINFAQKQVNAKIVYYGPGMSGKTTNLEVVHQRAPEQNKGDLTSISTDGDRTLFFDFMPLDLGTVAGMRTCFQIYTVPGQVYYNSTRKLVLQGVDGVVFVADSSASMVQENLDSLRNLEENLNEYGKSLATLAHVIQYNKRDLPDALPVDELNALLNPYGAPCFEAIASTGQGVFPTLKALAARVLESIHSSSSGMPAPRPQAPRAAIPAPRQQAAPAGFHAAPAHAAQAPFPTPARHADPMARTAFQPQPQGHAPAPHSGLQQPAPGYSAQPPAPGFPAQPIGAPVPPLQFQQAPMQPPGHAGQPPGHPGLRQTGFHAQPPQPPQQLHQTGFHGHAPHAQAQPPGGHLHMTSRAAALPPKPAAPAQAAPRHPQRAAPAARGAALEGTRFRPRAAARPEPRPTPSSARSRTVIYVIAALALGAVLTSVLYTYF